MSARGGNQAGSGRIGGMRMKSIARSVIAVGVLAGVVWINQSIMWPVTGVRMACNSEYLRVMRRTTRSYDSWGFDYSDGHQFDGETWENLWHWPTWHRAHWNADMEKGDNDTH